MEPRNGPTEQAPQLPQPEQWTYPGGGERAGAPETAPTQPEQLSPVFEQPVEARRVEVQNAVPPTTLPAPQADSSATSGTTITDDSTPLVAADEDVIEKEWVDKAKKIIDATKDDPYQREQQIKKLQADYLRKRYGRELGERAA